MGKALFKLLKILFVLQNKICQQEAIPSAKDFRFT